MVNEIGTDEELIETVEKFDLIETFNRNVFWLIKVFVYIITFVMLISTVQTVENDVNVLLGIIIVMLLLPKLLHFVGQPILCFKKLQKRK